MELVIVIVSCVVFAVVFNVAHVQSIKARLDHEREAAQAAKSTSHL